MSRPQTAPTELAPVADDADGRRHRLWIILGVAAVILVGGLLVQTVAARRADDRMSALRADLIASFQTTTSDDFIEFVYASTNDDSPDLIDALTTIGGVEPNTVQADGDTIHARYGIDALGSTRCVRVTWTRVDVDLEEGSGGRCTALRLD